MRSVMVLVVALTALALSSSLGSAGQNAGGTVALSWDAAGDSVTGVAPSASTFPLFLHLAGASDIQQLAINLKFIPHDSTGECYGVVPASPDSSCGWVTADSPGGTFLGDSSYTWSIHFPAGASKECIVYWVSTATCDTTPSAKFYVASALALDSNGAVDTLTLVASARLLGGSTPDTSYFDSAAHRAPSAPPSSLNLVAMPNPASGGTVLRFVMPGAIAFRLGIYDVSGRLVRRATVTPTARGAGQFIWDLTQADGQRVRAGVYFARLVTERGTRVVPVTVLR